MLVVQAPSQLWAEAAATCLPRLSVLLWECQRSSCGRMWTVRPLLLLPPAHGLACSFYAFHVDWVFLVEVFEPRPSSPPLQLRFSVRCCTSRCRYEGAVRQSDRHAVRWGACRQWPRAGVLTCDPRVVRDARVVSELTFDEATELSYFGAQVLPTPAFSVQAHADPVLLVCSSPQSEIWELHHRHQVQVLRAPSSDAPSRSVGVFVQVLHPAAMQPLQTLKDDVLIRVRNSYNLAASGSLIVKDRHQEAGGLITSIVLKEGAYLSMEHTNP